MYKQLSIMASFQGNPGFFGGELEKTENRKVKSQKKRPEGRETKVRDLIRPACKVKKQQEKGQNRFEFLLFIPAGLLQKKSSGRWLPKYIYSVVGPLHFSREPLHIEKQHLTDPVPSVENWKKPKMGKIKAVN